jgi:uncharacterized protein involved in cysteine biosynthesis
LLHLEDKDLLQIDATVIAAVLVLSTVGALKFSITVIAWVASTVIWFSFSAFLILVSYLVKPDPSTDDHKTKTNQVLTRKVSIGSMAAGFVYLIGVILTFFIVNLSHLMK